MPRTEVYQLRLYPGEKEKLSTLAAKGGHQSIATMIRQTFGLDTAEPKAGPIPSKPTDLVAKILTDVQRKDTENTLSDRAKQLQGQGYTTRVAERMAREEMA